MWESTTDRLALVELLRTGRLPRRRAQDAAWTWLASLDWTRTGTRRDELLLDDRRRDAVVELLTRVWPEWTAVDADLLSAGLPPTPKGLGTLLDQRRKARVGALPERINQRTAAAAVAPHSKATLTADRLSALGDAEVTHDGSVRLRPPVGLVLRRGDTALAASLVASVLGEVAIPDRAFRDGLVLDGAIAGVLLVENLGAFQDVKAPDGWLVAHVPGWDTATVQHLLARVGDVPVVHFGDLDPNGVRIHRHLRAMHPALRWLVPAWWAELVAERSLRAAWPDDLDVSDAPPLVHRLAAEGRWLEQEAIVLDSRLGDAIVAAARP